MSVLRFLRQGLLKHLESCARVKGEGEKGRAFQELFLCFSPALIQQDTEVTLQPLVAKGTTTDLQKTQQVINMMRLAIVQLSFM